MKTLVKKMSSFGLLRVQMIMSAVVMVAAVVALPVSILVGDPSLLLNPYVLGVVLAGMLLFGFFVYFLSVRPYRAYRNSPEVLVEADQEYLYIHGKKEAKIPLAELDGTSTFVHLPFLYSNELVAVLFVHLFSEEYGDLDLDIPGYGSFKLKYVSNVRRTSDELIAFINKSLRDE